MRAIQLLGKRRKDSGGRNVAAVLMPEADGAAQRILPNTIRRKRRCTDARAKFVRAKRDKNCPHVESGREAVNRLHREPCTKAANDIRLKYEENPSALSRGEANKESDNGRKNATETIV